MSGLRRHCWRGGAPPRIWSTKSEISGINAALRALQGRPRSRARCQVQELRIEPRSAMSPGRTRNAVGTPITGRPPHRSGRAQLRHPAPTSDE